MKKMLNKYSIGASVVLNLVAIIGFIYIAVNWLRHNTSTFTADITESQLQSNNLNSSENSLYNLQEISIGSNSLNIPDGFKVTVYAEDIPSARFFDFAEDGTMYIGSKDGDTVFALRDNDADGVVDERAVVDQGLRVPHSVEFYEGNLYLAEEHQVTVYEGIASDGTYSAKNVIIEDLPGGNQLTGGGHRTRTVKLGPDRKLYLTIGSSCNVCEEDDERRATMMRFDLDGSNGEIIATGLRNTVGFDFAESGEIWSADMGRDQIGDDIPFEEINIISPGNDYGWPYCWGDGFANPEFPEYADICKNETKYPIFNMQAHSAPLGVAFLNDAAKSSWPSEMRDGLLVAFHGSWNRTVPTGYKVVLLDNSKEQITQHTLISGWLGEDAEAWGRPVGLGFDNDGNLYVSDDKRGVVYRMSYAN